MAADSKVSIDEVAADRPPLAGNDALRERLGGLLIAAVPQFYSLVPIDPERLSRILGDAIGVSGSEFDNALMAGKPDAPLGIATTLPVARLHSAQQVSTVMLMRHLDRGDLGAFRSAVAEYGKGVEPIDSDGAYCSRITVAPEARGRGVGWSLLERIRADAGDSDVWLHVSADNERAIDVYRKFGFEFASDAPFPSKAMILRT